MEGLVLLPKSSQLSNVTIHQSQVCLALNCSALWMQTALLLAATYGFQKIHRKFPGRRELASLTAVMKRSSFTAQARPVWQRMNLLAR